MQYLFTNCTIHISLLQTKLNFFCFNFNTSVFCLIADTDTYENMASNPLTTSKTEVSPQAKSADGKPVLQNNLCPLPNSIGDEG